MKAGELAEILMRGPTRSLDSEVKVVIYRPGSVGGLPAVPVRNAGFGIDWDARTFQIFTTEQITTLTPEDVEMIRKDAVKGQSWHAYQAYKKQFERIKALEAELAALRATLVAPTPSPL